MSEMRIPKYFPAGLLTLLFALSATAQSLDARFPSPVRQNEVVGRIAARDIGDARLTDHFYSFAGTPGDLVITIETRNLNGDIDVFTAGSLRPVLKLALYAESTSPVTKSIYLRQREELILRVEARTPNDDEGVYHLKFSGSFEALAGTAENGEEAAAVPVNRKGKRVSSVGARIDEPVPPQVDVPAAAAPEETSANTPDPPPAEIKASEPKTAEVKTPEPKSETPVAPAPRVSRNTRTSPSSRRTATRPAATAAEPAPEKSTAKTKSEPPESPEKATPEKAPPATATSESEPPAATPPKTRNSKRSTTAKTREAAKETATVNKSEAATEPAPTEPGEQSPAKIVIEMLDGTKFERDMSAVRRVTVESGQIVVIGVDGKVNRIRLASVLRMSIGK
jgi:hypothetical protein